MEKNIVRKIKRYSINNNKKGGANEKIGDIITLRRTQEELLKTLVTIKGAKKKTRFEVKVSRTLD